MRDEAPGQTGPKGVPTIDVEEAARVIGNGGVIAYPTEAVFGLGCDPTRTDAVQRILAIKDRPADKGLILVAASLDQLQAWSAPLEPAWRSRLEDAWPGPVTFVLPADRESDLLVRGGHLTIAVRVSAHPVVRALCECCGHALVSTSANPSGKPALRTAKAVLRTFGQQIDGIVDGETGGDRYATTIVDVRTGRRLRG